MAGQTFTFNIKAVADMKDVISNITNIQSALGKLKLPDNLQSSFKDVFKNLTKEVDNYQRIMASGFKTKGDANALQKSGNNIIRLYDEIAKKINSIDDSTLKKAFEDLGAKEVEKLRIELTGLENDLKTKLSNQKFIDFSSTKSDLKSLKTEFTGVSEEAQKAQSVFKTLSNSTINTFIKNLESGRLDLAANNFESIRQKVEELNNTKLNEWFEGLKAGFEQIKGDDGIKSLSDGVLDLKQKLTTIQADSIIKLVNQFKQGKIGIDQFQNELGQVITSTNEWGVAQANTNKELDQVKSRIQYLLGLNNAINLIKRALRGAFNTIKDLDKAMTATAVVTDFTVSDMWEQLPEYTKRANQLGVTTQAAYESATLFYQQGLNTQQAAELSTETMKMARIAGLDAAEATDRMTNALRGFNMELNATAAQRVDDVYSELAAHSASNVDEISTAMTKVASLAHSANMEFETTAAFLAQIIETTRESAETAGTALKTVVARFSEVKKLYSEDELKGTDEEGQTIDVNKISTALHTAGIDLNQYFLGEVGLDDIFMELASKWDTLTSVQQRYIATQAAGSRQQSRFIALMQDYARTQELVGLAYDANGASAKQFEKTQDSLESKLNRLKNAWNEFLMGLANSTLVKTFIDVLTGLLNILNKITSVLGEGAGFILKWGAAIGIFKGLKSLFKDNGLASQLLGKIMPNMGQKVTGAKALDTAAVTAGKTLTTAATEAASILVRGATEAAAVETTGATEETATEVGGGVEETTIEVEGGAEETTVEVTGGTIETGEEVGGGTAEEEIEISGAVTETAIENSKFGKGGGSGLLSKLFNATPGAAWEASAGVGGGGAATSTVGGGLSTTLFGAAGSAVPAATIAGFAALLIALEAGAVALQDYVASGEAQVKHAEKVVKKQEKQVEDSQNAAEKQKEAYEAYLENEKIARTATGEEKAQAEANMSEALEVLYSIDVNNVIKTETGYELNQGYAKDNIKVLEEQAALEEATLAFEEARVAAAKEYVEWGKQYSIVYDTEAGSITQGSAFAQAYSGSIWEGSKHIVTGSEADYMAMESWNANQRSKAAGFEAQAATKITEGATTLLSSVFEDQGLISTVAQAYGQAIDKGTFKNKTTDDIKKDLTNLMDVASDNNGKILLDVINGSYEGLISDEQFVALFNNLTPEYQETIKTLIGKEGETIEQTLANYSTKLRKSQIDFRKKSVATLHQNGLKNLDQLGRIANELSLSETQKLVEMSDQFADFGSEFNDTIITAISDQMLKGTWNNSALESFVKTLSDNPILTFEALDEAATHATGEVQVLATQLREIAKKSDAFSTKNQVQWFLAEGIADIEDEVQSLVEANGKLNSKNIQDLAEKSKTLATLLDNDIISANALAMAMNALSEGKITIFDLNESVLQLYESFDTVANAIQRAGQFIKDFDPGEDWGDAFDFINDAIDKMTELINNRELGNPQLRNYLKAFFEVPPDSLEGMEQAVALLKEMQGLGGANFWTKAVGFSMDENGEITDMGVDAFAQSDFTSYRDYIKSLAEENGYTNFSDEYYDLMIRNAADHDYGFLTDVAAQEVNKIAEAYGKGLKPGEGISKTDIQAIADAYGLDPQEILNAYTDKFGLEHIDFSSLQDKIRSTVTDINGKVTDEVRKAFIQARKDQGDTEGEANRAWQNKVDSSGLDNTSFILSELGVDSTGHFSIDALYANIGKIVPEVQDGTMSAADWVQEQINNSPDGVVTLPVKYEQTVQNDDDTFSVITQEVQVEVSNLDEYEAAVKSIQQQADVAFLGSSLVGAFGDAQTQAEALASFVSEIGKENSISEINGAITNCKATAEDLQKELSKTAYKDVVVSASPSSINISGEGQTISFSISTAALGGIVKSYAAGSGNILSPGLALTGEEAPEIIWNKEKGYAYLAGANGPEINNLQPGDQVFNGDQTKEILKRSGLSSFAKGTIPSYKGGTIWNNEDNNGSGGGSGSGSGKDKDDDWYNDLDWLYNVMENIAELEREQNRLEEEYEDLLADQTKTGQDLYKMLIKQLGNLYTQLDTQTYVLAEREREMREFMDTTNDQDQYLWYNWEDRTLEIDWDAIDLIDDKELYDHVKDLINEAESIQDKMDDAEDAIIDINNSIQDLENIWRDTFTDFEERVLKAIVSSYQNVIDNYSELNDTLNNTNQSILDAINKEISLQRQIRDNTKTEEEIADNEAQLAYLRRDTTGGNDLAALQLEKELDDQRQNYEDNLVDQAVQRLQDDNDAAAAQREQQIEIMQAQLDYQSENGEFNAYIRELIDSAISPDGTLATDSDLYKLLASQENADAMTKVGRQVWEEELDTNFKEVVAFLLKQQNEAEGTYFTAVSAAFNGLQEQFDKLYHGSQSQSSRRTDYSGNTITRNPEKDPNVGAPPPTSEPDRYTLHYMPNGSGYTVYDTQTNKPVSTTHQGGSYSQVLQDVNEKNKKPVKGINGGLFDTTGIMQIDGTADAPEYVLNARQTDAFLRLADVLPAAMSNTGSSVSNTFGSTTNNIVINVDKIDSDYSVDQMVDRVKEKLFESGSYRNNNVLNFLR